MISVHQIYAAILLEHRRCNNPVQVDVSAMNANFELIQVLKITSIL